MRDRVKSKIATSVCCPVLMPIIHSRRNLVLVKNDLKILANSVLQSTGENGTDASIQGRVCIPSCTQNVASAQSLSKLPLSRYFFGKRLLQLGPDFLRPRLRLGLEINRFVSKTTQCSGI